MLADSQLRQRVITAVILIPLVVGSVFVSPVFNFLSVIVLFFAGLEWFALAERLESAAMTPYPSVKNKDGLTIYSVLLFFLLLIFSIPELSVSVILMASCVWWIFAAWLVLTYPKTNEEIKKMRVAGRLAAQVLEMIEPIFLTSLTNSFRRSSVN
jgi:phosphatidate cytidylyltransferase